MNPFTFIKDSYNHETLLEARKLEKLEIQLAKSRTARIFNLRCLANNVTPKTMQIKWKGNKFEQAMIKKAECLLIHNRMYPPPLVKASGGQDQYYSRSS